MKNFFSVGSNAGSIFATLAILILLGSFYFFIYVPDNERELQMQRFRTLQNIERNIHAKIENTDSLLNNLLNAYSKAGEKSRVIEFINNYNSDRFEFIPIHTSFIKRVQLQDKQLLISIDSIKQQFNFILSKTDTNGKKEQIGILYKFSQFIKPLLPSDVFDNYIVLSSGIPLYETFPSGLSFTNEDSLIKAKSGVNATGLPTQRIGGVDYKVFVQPVYYPGINKRLVVAGLLSEKRYYQERNSLPPRAVRFLLIAGFAMILAFPWIKIFQMGNKDRLTMVDGMSSIIVAMLLMSLLFFAFSAYNLRFRPSDSPDSKLNLAKKLTKAFESEVASAYDKLAYFDTLRNSISILDGNIRRARGNRLEYFSNGSWMPLSDTIQIKLNRMKEDPGIRQVFWLNKDGWAINSWTNIHVSVPLANLKDRDYFKYSISGQGNIIDTQQRAVYYLDQIISWTRGSFTNVISKPSSFKYHGENVVAAMTFNDKSLRNVLLPPGYSFAIINKKGKVLYHSDESKKLTENIIDELSEKNKLLSNMEALTASTFNTKYFGKEYELQLIPLKTAPYFVIIFSDVSYKETRDMEIFFFTTSMLFSFFALLIIQLVIMFIASSRRSIFKKEIFDISWMGPKKSFRKPYILAVLANGTSIALLTLFFNITTFLEYVFILLFTITAIGLFLNGIYVRYYDLSNQLSLKKLKITVIVSLILCLFLVNFAAWLFLDHPFRRFVVFEAIIVCIFSLLFFIRKIVNSYKLRRLSKLTAKWDYITMFSLLAFTRLIITSGIPVVFFYIHSYNYEQNLSIRYKHIQYADQIVDKYPVLNRNIEELTGVYIDSSWINSIKILKNRGHLPEPYSKEERYTLSLLSLFRYYENDKAIGSASFYKTSADDSSFFFNHLFKEAGKTGVGTITYKYLNDQDNYLRISSYPLNYNLPSIFTKARYDRFKGLLFWLLVLLTLLMFFLVVNFIIKRLFALNIPDTRIWEVMDDHMQFNKVLNNLLFIIGSPGSGKLTQLLEKFDNHVLIGDNDAPYVYNHPDPERNNVFIADLILIPDTGDTDPHSLAAWRKVIDDSVTNDYSLIVVNHFEYNIKDQTTNHHKLNYLETLMAQKSTSKVIVLSTIHPVTFLDSYHEEKMHEQGKSLPEQDLERWHVLLGHFRIVIQPLVRSRYNAAANDQRRTLIQETQYTHFLKKMRRSALKVSALMHNNSEASEVDSLAFKLQVTSHYFYMYIWQSLTKEEKFLLYDLAEDGLVNPFDDYNLSLLISKGIIIRNDGTLQLFNKGFRNFILTAIGNTEATKIKNQIKDNGNWSRLKNPLILLIIAIFTFLFTSQQETYSRLIVYVSAIGAGVPALLKIFSLFEKNTQKTS